MSNVISLTEHQERREQAYWDTQARECGYTDFAALEAAYTAEFDARLERFQRQCTHPEKHQDIELCANCADRWYAEQRSSEDDEPPPPARRAA